MASASSRDACADSLKFFVTLPYCSTSSSGLAASNAVAICVFNRTNSTSCSFGTSILAALSIMLAICTVVSGNSLDKS